MVDERKLDYAHRLFQCRVVSKRPLRVEELAELFAIQLNGTKRRPSQGRPKALKLARPGLAYIGPGLAGLEHPYGGRALVS